MKVFTTSYKSRGLKDLFFNLVKSCDPITAVELGTQQGSSAILIGKALNKKGKLVTIDLFEEKYRLEPHGHTHAQMDVAIKNIKEAGLENKVEVRKGDALEAYQNFEYVDFLHIDLCNYYEIVFKVLDKWVHKVSKMILIEGGVYNYWQKEIGLKPFTEVLNLPFITDKFDKCTIVGKNDHSLTILTRKIENE